jgi:hypothetical protein
MALSAIIGAMALKDLVVQGQLLSLCHNEDVLCSSGPDVCLVKVVEHRLTLVRAGIGCAKTWFGPVYMVPFILCAGDESKMAFSISTLYLICSTK